MKRFYCKTLARAVRAAATEWCERDTRAYRRELDAE